MSTDHKDGVKGLGAQPAREKRVQGQEAGVFPEGVVSGGLSEKVGLKQRPDRGEGFSYVVNWEEEHSSRENHIEQRP